MAASGLNPDLHFRSCAVALCDGEGVGREPTDERRIDFVAPQLIGCVAGMRVQFHEKSTFVVGS